MINLREVCGDVVITDNHTRKNYTADELHKTIKYLRIANIEFTAIGVASFPFSVTLIRGIEKVINETVNKPILSSHLPEYIFATAVSGWFIYAGWMANKGAQDITKLLRINN